MTTSWSGSGAAPGVAVAASWRADRPAPAMPDQHLPTGQQVEQAFRAVAAEFDQIARQASAQGRHTAADIMTVGVLIASDVSLVDAARDAAAASDDPLRAVRDVVELHAAALEQASDATLRERAADIRQIGRRVIHRLTHGTAGASATPPSHSFVLVTAEIGPADLLEHLGQGLAAAVAVRGGANSHAAIIARSVGLPLVTGVDPALLELPDHTPLLVDATQGLVVAYPDASQVHRIRSVTEHEDRRRVALAADRGRQHATADGQPFMLLANVATAMEARVGIDTGAQGIGLLRTELAFLKADRWPDEADHRQALRSIFAEAAGLPLTVRLLDFTNDKMPVFLASTSGGPVGLAGLLATPDALVAQLRAVLDLGRHIDLRIMAPMVATAQELRALRAAITAVAHDLGIPVPPVGAMIETVAAAEAIHDLAEVADFFSVGTNDLASQALGLDRRDPRARPELAAHPRVVQLIGRVAAIGARSSRPVSICGDAAAHPATLPLLLGTGIRMFSVACACIDQARYLLLRLDTGRCAELVAQALECDDADEVLALVANRSTERHDALVMDRFLFDATEQEPERW
jgi:phosphoenolpyruvate-protein kinase (PTS system EI component)